MRKRRKDYQASAILESYREERQNAVKNAELEEHNRAAWLRSVF
jgi:hypothetical protein